MANVGIDYGLGRTNIDTANGIRYGCISVHAVTQAWYDTAEADYGKPHCPKCGNEITDDYGEAERPDTEEYDGRGSEYACHDCRYTFDGDEAYSDEPLGWTLEDEEYTAVDCLDSDVLIIKSPYYTYGPFCSPCVPGAVTLYDDRDRAQRYSADHGVKAYCFGHDWFEDGQAPYKVYRVADDSEVLPDGQ